jgi:hypothetical protein
MDLHMPQSGARVHNELKSDVSPCSSWVESAVWTSASHFRFTPISRPLQSDTGLRIGGNKGSFRFALAIRKPTLGLTKKHNFISPNDDRKRRSSGNKQS